MSAIARWCYRHRFVVIAAWVVLLIGLGTLSQAVKSHYNNSFSLPGTGSTTAQQLLAKAVPAQAGDSDTIRYTALINNDIASSNCPLTALPMPTFSGTAIGDNATVALSCTFRFVTPFIGNIFPSGMTMSASSV